MTREKLFGFLTNGGIRVFEKIRRYHRNVALWLAPPEKQKELAIYALWRCLDLPELKEGLSLRLNVRAIGLESLPFLSSKVGSVMARTWWVQIESRQRVKNLLSNPSIEVQAILPILDEFMTGGILSRFMIRRNKNPGQARRQSYESLIEMAEYGLEIGLEQFAAFVISLREGSDEILKTLGVPS